MIESTTDDLEVYLESINENLEKIVGKNASGCRASADGRGTPEHTEMLVSNVNADSGANPRASIGML